MDIRSGVRSIFYVVISQTTPKVHGRALRANTVLISYFLGVPHYFGDVGRPEWMSDPGSDLSSKWLSPKPPQKYTDVPSRLLQLLLATTYVSLSLMGTSDVRNGRPDRVRIYSLKGYLPNDSRNTRPCIPDV